MGGRAVGRQAGEHPGGEAGNQANGGGSAGREITRSRFAPRPLGALAIDILELVPGWFQICTKRFRVGFGMVSGWFTVEIRTGVRFGTGLGSVRPGTVQGKSWTRDPPGAILSPPGSPYVTSNMA